MLFNNICNQFTGQAPNSNNMTTQNATLHTEQAGRYNNYYPRAAEDV